ncbi:MAG TPA: class I SAM-dependent methyltransferase [Bacilli bacterium]|nr:class I SAM-dependent methyltransferase [Bacilli bacterium]
MENKVKNAERFRGFADIYDSARPAVPYYPIEKILSYLKKRPTCVVDIGCGTGLSTVVWKDSADFVIGIEPSLDMISVARKKPLANVKFIQAFSDQTTLESNMADVVICSQSFHWMEPDATLKEINRILKNGGIFATIDYDWPPVSDWEAEKAYKDLINKERLIENSIEGIRNTFFRYDKTKHLENIERSGYFRYSREILFSNKEKCDARRFMNLMLSHGGLQTILRKSPNLIEEDLKKFEKTIKRIFAGKEFEIDFCYRMRIGIK